MPVDFFAFLTARAAVSLVTAMLTIAIGWHLYQNSGDPFDLALVGLMQIIPIFLFFFVTGWATDSLPRKALLIICTITEAVILISITMAMLVDDLNLTVIFALLFAHGGVKAFYTPAQQAIIPNIVPPAMLSRAIALNSTIGKVFATAGPLLAGVLITVIDVYTYLVAAGLMGISTIAYLFLPKLTQLKPIGRSLDMVLGGVAYVRSNSIVLGAIALDLFIVLMGSVVTLLPVYAADILNVGPESLGVLRGMPALGGVVVGLGLAAMPPMRRSGLCLFAALLVFAASILVFAVSTIFWVSLVALFVYGAADMVSVNIRMTLIQLATPDHLRGRVSAVNAIFISSSNEMGDVRAGSAAALLGPVTTVFIGGLAALSVAIGGWYVFPKLRHLDRLADLCPPDGPKLKGDKNDQ
ncbi:MFS transporter [Alphaproteobacteria bacterium]|nr:MFS transporter [Alphaproteobacteria bacterium]